MLRRMIGRTIAAVLLGLALFAPVANAQTSRQADVVVELYTAQGCDQCPRANRLLGMLAGEDNTLALTLPVGIWDYLGWEDTLALPEFADRQRAYSRTLRVRGRFTPQLIINGRTQLSASYWDEARAAYDTARGERATLAPEITITRPRNFAVRITLGPGRARVTPADIWMVSYDPGPVNVYVSRGINRYRRVFHYNVATSIENLGPYNGGAVWFDRGRCSPACAVIVQEPYGGPIISAAYLEQR
jgi:hypothetical protein